MSIPFGQFLIWEGPISQRVVNFPLFYVLFNPDSRCAMALPRQKVVVVGAGPVGSLAALYAASRGDDVEVYELRGGMFKMGLV